METDLRSPVDTTVFPDPIYRDTVLRPLFDDAKRHHADALARIDRAHLVMLVETGILSAEQGREIGRALRSVEEEVDPGHLEYGDDVEDLFFHMEKELKARAGADIGGRLHTARSRNDIDHTLFRIGLKARIDTVLEGCVNLLNVLIEVAERESATLIVAYTHGQPAQPSTYGHYLGAVIEVLIRDMERIEAARATVDLSPMGAAAITTSGFPIDRHRVAALLGFAGPLRNSYSCIATVDYITATFSALELLMLHLGRPIQDFQVWTSFEVGQLHLPNALVQISSIMPQKRNPVPIEHLRHLASQTRARSRAVLDIVHNTPFTDMNDSEGETQAFGYQAFATADRVLRLLTTVIRAATVPTETVMRNLRRSCATITELADTLVRSEGLSFRQAHEIAALVARAVVAGDGNLGTDGYDPFEEAFKQVVGRPTAIDRDTFADAVSPERFVAVRDRFGGPAPAALADAILSYRAAAAGFMERAERRRQHEIAAADELDRAYDALLGDR